MGIPKFTNPTYKRLLEQVKVENSISYEKGDYYNFFFTGLADFASFKKAKIRSQEIIDKQINGEEFGLNNLLSNILLLFTADKINHSVPSKFIKKVRYDFKSLLESTSFPIGNKSLILFCAQKIDYFNEYKQKLNEDLTSRTEKEFKQRNFLKAFDLVFGCEKNSSFHKYINSDFDLIVSEAGKWPREKISKAIIWLNRNKIPSTKLINILESKVEEEFASWVKPDIWFSIIESEKLINSNVDQSVIKDVLFRLKQEDDSWASKISKIEENGVFIELDNLIRSPAFSPIEDTLCVIALNSVSRDRTVQVNEEEYRSFKVYKESTGDPMLYSNQQLFILLAGIIILSITLGLLIPEISKEFKQPIKFLGKIISSDFGDLGILLTPWGLLILNVFWLYSLISKGYSMSVNSYADIFYSCPLYFILIKPLLSDNDT